MKWVLIVIVSLVRPAIIGSIVPKDSYTGQKASARSGGGQSENESVLKGALLPSYLQQILLTIEEDSEYLLKHLNHVVSQDCLGHTFEWILQITSYVNHGIKPELWVLHSKSGFQPIPNKSKRAPRIENRKSSRVAPFTYPFRIKNVFF